MTKQHLAAYVRVPSLQDEDECSSKPPRSGRKGKEIDRVICLWEPGVLFAARLREELGTAGMTVEECHAVSRQGHDEGESRSRGNQDAEARVGEERRRVFAPRSRRSATRSSSSRSQAQARWTHIA